MMTIEGLSAKQMIIADALWGCETEGEVASLFKVFPASEVIVVKEMMIAATLDRIVTEPDEMVTSLLQRFYRA